MKKIIGSFLMIILLIKAFAQDENKKHDSLVFSGYVQAQYQHFFVPDSVGSTTPYLSTFSGGNFANRFTTDRFMIRRGRIKIQHFGKLHSSALSFDITERGIAVKDAYLSIKEPFIKSFIITAGMFNRPFGEEIDISSSQRETPERSRVIQTLFPNERDLGIQLSFENNFQTPWSYFDFKTAIVNGNGTAVETDNYKDWLGRIGFKLGSGKDSKVEFKAGFSWYKGYIQHIYEPVDTIASNTTTKYYIYRFQEVEDSTHRTKMAFVLDEDASKAAGQKGSKIDRNYTGVDGELKIHSPLGKLTIRGEYIWGTQPSAVNYKDVEQAYIIYNGLNTMSPSGPFLGVSWPMYDQPQPYNPVAVNQVNKFHHTFIRKFNGGYIYFIQQLFNTRHQIVFKYDWYDPNTQVSGKDIVYDEDLYLNDATYIKPYLSPADVKFQTYGIGFNYGFNDNVKLCIYYEHVQNEKVQIKSYEGDIRLGRMPSPGFDKDIKDDALTIRLQYKF